MVNVAINGFGRIGRAVFKIVLETPELELKAINELIEPDHMAYLLKYDSVYGRYPGRVESEEGALVVDGKRYRVLREKDPVKLPWSDMGVDLVFECTGIFNTKEGLEKHVKAGARRVILSAPDKDGDIPLIVHGINEPPSSCQMLSCASCTTNCIAPVVEIMGRRIGLRKGIMTTIHAYTSSQAIVDAPSKKWRRGRAGAINFVPTSTGAAKATARALPELKGKFDGVAVRGPIPVGSLADLVFVTEKATSVEEVNTIFREESEGARYREVLAVSDEPIVSSDIIRDPHASIVDLTMTQVVDGDLVKIMSWYDNEWGYSQQMVREAKRLVEVG